MSSFPLVFGIMNCDIGFLVCVQGKKCVLYDCCQLLDGTVLLPKTVVPPFAIFGGNPGPKNFIACSKNQSFCFHS